MTATQLLSLINAIAGNTTLSEQDRVTVLRRIIETPINREYPDGAQSDGEEYYATTVNAGMAPDIPGPARIGRIGR